MVRLNCLIYEDNLCVIVDDLLLLFYCYCFGKMLFGFYYGYCKKKELLFELFVQQFCVDWGLIEYIYIYCGYCYYFEEKDKVGMCVIEYVILVVCDVYVVWYGYYVVCQVFVIIYYEDFGEWGCVMVMFEMLFVVLLKQGIQCDGLV